MKTRHCKIPSLVAEPGSSSCTEGIGESPASSAIERCGIFHRLLTLQRAAVVALFLLTAIALNAAEPSPIVGVWTTDEAKGTVEVFEREGKFCARIVSLAEPNYPADDKKGMGGKPRIDRENPDPKLRDRPIIGLEIMHGLKPASTNKWDGGRIYDPETGNTYSCKMTLVKTNELHLRGFLGISLIGRTTTWTR